MFTRHQLYQLYEEGREPTISLIESLLDYIEELKHDPHNRQQRHIAGLSERIAKLAARLKRVEEKLAKQQCLNYELKRRIAELEAAAVVRDSHNSSLPPALDPPAAKAANAPSGARGACVALQGSAPVHSPDIPATPARESSSLTGW